MNFLHTPARTLALGLALSLSFSVLHAQPVAALTEVVVVTATRTSKPLASVSAAIDVITREDIERSQASSLADVLRNAMGMELARNGGPGTVTSFFLRGHNSVNLVVLVDGIRTPTDGIGSLLALDIPVSRIERIEVLRGDASALYGGAANGGVLSINPDFCGSCRLCGGPWRRTRGP